MARSFGDLESKVKKFGGAENVVVATPEVIDLDIDSSLDFVFLASDGVYDVLSTKEVVEIIWETINFYKNKSAEKLTEQ